jgi:hypothetical protein
MYVSKFDDSSLVFYVRCEDLPHAVYKDILESMQKTILSLIKVRQVFKKEIQLDYDYNLILQHVNCVFNACMNECLIKKHDQDTCSDFMNLMHVGVTRYPYRESIKKNIIKTYIMKISDASYTVDECI